MLQHLVRCGRTALTISRSLMTTGTLSAVRTHSSFAAFRPLRSWGSVVSWTARPVRQASTHVAEAVTSETIDHSQRVVGAWLLGCSGMVFCAVVLGGVTRLTESGLSMVKWHPVGSLYPSTEEEWLAEFEDYKKYPEYKYSGGMSLEDFKRIFFMEYAHRMWGRLIGVVFAVPAAVFWYKGMFRSGVKPAIGGMALLLGFQGVLGWLMVKSGLDYDPEGKHVPRVSQYRLAAHLGSAFILYVLFLWQGLSHVLKPHKLEASKQLSRFRSLAHGTAMLVFFTAMSGAFVAGMDAGLIYNEFPLMGGRWIPEDIMTLTPAWLNIFENPTTAQFDHRYLGIASGLVVTTVWAMSRGLALPGRTRAVTNALFVMVGAQITLGISTLLYLVPVPLAATHQAGSLTLLTFAVWLLHELRTLPK